MGEINNIHCCSTVTLLVPKNTCQRHIFASESLSLSIMILDSMVSTTYPRCEGLYVMGTKGENWRKWKCVGRNFLYNGWLGLVNISLP